MPSQRQHKADSDLRRRAAAQVVPNDPSNVLVAALLQRRDRDAEARRQQERARGADKGKRPAEPGAERAAKRPGGASAGAGSSRQGPRLPCPGVTERRAIAPGRRARAPSAPGRLATQQPLALLHTICDCDCCVQWAGVQCAGQGPTTRVAVRLAGSFTTRWKSGALCRLACVDVCAEALRKRGGASQAPAHAVIGCQAGAPTKPGGARAQRTARPAAAARRART